MADSCTFCVSILVRGFGELYSRYTFEISSTTVHSFPTPIFLVCLWSCLSFILTQILVFECLASINLSLQMIHQRQVSTCVIRSCWHRSSLNFWLEQIPFYVIDLLAICLFSVYLALSYFDMFFSTISKEKAWWYMHKADVMALVEADFVLDPNKILWISYFITILLQSQDLYFLRGSPHTFMNS